LGAGPGWTFFTHNAYSVQPDGSVEATRNHGRARGLVRTGVGMGFLLAGIDGRPMSVFASYEMTSGEEIYRIRIPHAGSGFSASPLASDGRLFLPGEDGDTFVVRAGREFGLIGTNSIPETVMATPAISDGMLFIRGHGHVFAISN